MANSGVAPVAHRLLPILAWIPGYRRDWLLPDVLAGLALWASHGARGNGLRRHRRRAADHGALHDSAGAACLRAARLVAAARRRTGRRDRPDLRGDRRRHRNPRNCGIQFANVHSRGADRPWPDLASLKGQHRWPSAHWNLSGRCPSFRSWPP